MLAIVQIVFGGKTFRGSTHTRDHLKWTAARLKKRWGPLARIEVIQPCYSNPKIFTKSAGTHNFDGVLDVRIKGIPGLTKKSRWMRAQSFLRWSGWAAEWRHTGIWAAESEWHIHMASIPPGLPEHPSPQQVGEAYRRLGVKVGHYIDGGLTETGRTYTSSQITSYMAARPLDGLADHLPDLTPRPSPVTAYVFKG